MDIDCTFSTGCGAT